MDRKERKSKYIQAKEALIARFHSENYENNQKIPTENDLIEELGFSRNTIRQAIMELEKEGVVRKEQGRGTYFISQERKGKTGRIGVVNFFMAKSVYPYMIHGIEDAAWHEGFTLIQSSSGITGDRELDAIKRIVEQGVDGIIYEPYHNDVRGNSSDSIEIINYLASLDMPIVTTHFEIPQLSCSSIVIDDMMIGYQAVYALHKHGHKKIGLVDIKDVQSSISRSVGYRKAMKELGLPMNPQWEASTKTGEFDSPDSEIRDVLCKAFCNEDRPTAVFCFNDDLAVILYDCVRNSGLVIGEDISILGVDNVTAAEVLHPGLSTFDHPKETLGKWAAQILTQKIKFPHEPNIKISFPPVLIERDSIADINS